MKKNKCDCGFVPGESIKHSDWCDSLKEYEESLDDIIEERLSLYADGTVTNKTLTDPQIDYSFQINLDDEEEII